MAPNIDGVTVEVGGAVFSEFAPPESEMIGLAFAIVILIVAFGSVMAMGLPIAVALAGVGTGGFGVVSLMSHGISIPEFAPLIGIMIGLGVGIDYALFMVTRYRELTRAGYSPEDATAGSLNTAGRAVVFAGITVVFSLLGMITVGLGFVSGLGIAAAATVAVTLLASITLLPALLGVFHSKVEVTRWRGLIAAGCVSLALLGVGLSLSALSAIGAVFAVLTVLGSIAIRPSATKFRPDVSVRFAKRRRIGGAARSSVDRGCMRLSVVGYSSCLRCRCCRFASDFPTKGICQRRPRRVGRTT